MMIPLQDRVLVRLDESIASARSSGIYIPPKTDAWRSKGGAIEGENRGTVVSVGPGKVSEEGVALGMMVQPGDVVRFSELEYPSEMIEGRKHVLISEMDILWVEEADEPATKEEAYAKAMQGGVLLISDIQAINERFGA